MTSDEMRVKFDELLDKFVEEANLTTEQILILRKFLDKFMNLFGEYVFQKII